MIYNFTVIIIFFKYDDMISDQLQISYNSVFYSKSDPALHIFEFSL